MEIQILPRSIAVKLSKISISQLHVSSCAVCSHQLTCTATSRQLFLDRAVQTEEVTCQAPSRSPASTSHAHTPPAS